MGARMDIAHGSALGILPEWFFVATSPFLRLAASYIQLRDELAILRQSPYSCPYTEAELRYRLNRVRARMACAPVALVTPRGGA